MLLLQRIGNLETDAAEMVLGDIAFLGNEIAYVWNIDRNRATVCLSLIQDFINDTIVSRTVYMTAITEFIKTGKR